MERPVDFYTDNLNKGITVYLKDNTIVKGILVAADLNFNLRLKDAEYIKGEDRLSFPGDSSKSVVILDKIKVKDMLLNGRAVKFVS